MVSEYRLTNGIKVVCDPIANSNSVAFGVWVTVGSQNEKKENNGIAHMIEHMVFKGTKKRSAVQIADEIADVGGNIDAYTSKEVTSYYAWVLPENLNKTIDLLSDMLLHSQFFEEEFEKEKSIVMEEIDMYKEIVGDKKILGYDMGGGTPTQLEIDQLQRITEKIFKTFNFDENTEASIETTPVIAARDFDKIASLYDMGYRRISMGIQTINPKLLEAFGREGNNNIYKSACENIRAAGFKKFNVEDRKSVV